MANYRRADVAGGTFFFTVVTHQRRKILTTDLARSILRDSFRRVKDRHPFSVDGIVLLPDHMHTIWTLPTGDNDFPTRWRQIKSLFTREWIASGGSESGVSLSQSKQGSRGVWQRRYIEKTIQDEADMRRHHDYIHINPVKHQLCEKASDWQ